MIVYPRFLSPGLMQLAAPEILTIAQSRAMAVVIAVRLTNKY